MIKKFIASIIAAFAISCSGVDPGSQQMSNEYNGVIEIPSNEHYYYTITQDYEEGPSNRMIVHGDFSTPQQAKTFSVERYNSFSNRSWRHPDFQHPNMPNLVS